MMRPSFSRPKLIRRKPLKHGRVISRARREIKGMTVCVAALASGGDGIVCIADKALSYGDYIQWDSDTTKIIPLRSNNGVLMVSGGENSSRVVNALLAISFDGSIGDMITDVEKSYQSSYDQVLEIKFLRQNGITREQYFSAISGPQINRHIEHIADQIEHFSLDVDVIICGYMTPEPFMLSVTSPGKAIDLAREGFHAIGSGYDHAIARLLFHEHKRTNPIPETLYECFDAKAHAEMAAGVGYEWDAYVVVPARAVSIDEKIKPLLDKIWAKGNRTPFYKKKDGDLAGPPRNWRQQLDDIIKVSLEKSGVRYQQSTGTLVVASSSMPVGVC